VTFSDTAVGWCDDPGVPSIPHAELWRLTVVGAIALTVLVAYWALWALAQLLSHG
jgi:hypothetical protein